MNKLRGLSDSPNGATENAGRCERCRATAQVGQGFCVNCLLREGLAAQGEASSEVFESVLAEANVPDQQWRLGNYEILDEIGRGGMGVIYRARQRHSRRIVAVKRILAYQSDSNETLVRFRREAEASARLDHPNILPIYEVSESEDGLPFFSMKYATGGNLRGAIPALRPEPNECVRLMAKIARAISYAHEHGILHRDLQPGNILLDGNGEPMVSDFGLAKWLDENSDLTRTLTTFGTPGYIAPEQAVDAAGNITPAADIYSLGAILFHLFTNRPPFVGANVLSVIHQAAATPAPRLRSLAPSLDRDLETILARCLERDPKARYQTAKALAEDLERWLEGRPILARRVLVPARMWRWARRNPVLSGAVTACLVLVATVLLLLRGQFSRPPELPLPEKSIAVLPFENISDNKENSEFAAGIQDDLLTSLAKISALKVISRTSVMQYRTAGAARNLHEIAQALGVTNIMEGTVRRVGNRALINVQLIDARNDRPIWSERYDRTIADSIGLQGELATEIAAALKAKLAPEERVRLATKPTTNPEAYLLYLRGMELSRTAASKEDAFATDELFGKAIELDPTFALAIARRSMWNVRMYMVGRRPENKAAALALAAQALQLSPDLPEAHVALGLCFYRIEKNYDAALREFSSAEAASAMEPDILDQTAAIYCRQGRWRKGLATYDRAQELDPRQPHSGGSWTRAMLRDWPGAVAGFQRLLTIAPNDIDIAMGYANVSIQQSGDFAIASKLLASIPPGLHGAPGQPSMIDVALTQTRWGINMLARDYAAAEKVLADYKGDQFMEEPLGGVKSYDAAQTALARGDVNSARSLFEQARPVYEGNARAHPDDARSHASLGLLYAYLGRKDEAIRESLRAVELVPESKDAQGGPDYAANLALVYARTGEVDQAVALVERLLTIPGSLTLVDLRLNWEWDPLRNDPRFQKILAGPEPKTVY